MKKERVRLWVLLLFGGSVFLVFVTFAFFLKPSKPQAARERTAAAERFKRGTSSPSPSAPTPASGAKGAQAPPSTSAEQNRSPALSAVPAQTGGEQDQVSQLPAHQAQPTHQTPQKGDQKSRKERWLEGFKQALEEKDRGQIGAYLKELSVEPSLLQASDLSREEKETLENLGFSLSAPEEPPSAEEKLTPARASSRD